MLDLHIGHALLLVGLHLGLLKLELGLGFQHLGVWCRWFRLLHGRISEELLRCLETSGFDEFRQTVVDVFRGRHTNLDRLALRHQDLTDVRHLLFPVARAQSDRDCHVPALPPTPRVNRHPLVAQPYHFLLHAVLPDQLMHEQQQITQASLGEGTGNEFLPTLRGTCHQARACRGAVELVQVVGL